MFLPKEQMKEFCINLLISRGVKLSDITELVYYLQQKYIPDLSLDVCEEAVGRVLSKREVQNAILTGVELDVLAEKGLLSEPLQTLVKGDNPLYGIDEILVLSITNIYGSIGLTNFGYIDKVKPGIIGRIDKEGKAEGHCHTFLDDIVGAVAAAAASSVAHNSAP